LEGVKELYEINQGLFSGYFDSVIFNEAAKSLERAVQDKHTNERLDKVINEFLVAVSPYMMIKAPLKCMEWLVCRFHIEKFNVDTVLKCTVFYHSMIPRLLHWSLRFLKDRNSRRTPNGFGWYRQFKRDCPCRKLYSFCESECKVHHMTIRCADQVSCARESLDIPSVPHLYSPGEREPPLQSLYDSYHARDYSKRNAGDLPKNTSHFNDERLFDDPIGATVISILGMDWDSTLKYSPAGRIIQGTLFSLNNQYQKNKKNL
ncbi:unnamed protein product, partial [Allacma fusca]